MSCASSRMLSSSPCRPEEALPCGPVGLPLRPAAARGSSSSTQEPDEETTSRESVMAPGGRRGADREEASCMRRTAERRGNISLRAVDLTFNGFGGEGAVALGRALKENAALEELDVSNNRIPPEGALHLATGLKRNNTIKSLKARDCCPEAVPSGSVFIDVNSLQKAVGRNPIQTAGCYGILQALQENPQSAMEQLDFPDVTVNQDFDDLYSAVKEMFPALTM
ncbi:Leucine-rich repeat-containing protein 74B [Liparis tanakae]|uniref:Leucine-rich repeat-containing protein 74B n=1 Tax=Liparis tanakae TaxID=230148 RepID=A0A4Z2GC93_9TELE|nr:Leucine-rich repeat-containing protein 74B [Liparis tanakae]